MAESNCFEASVSPCLMPFLPLSISFEPLFARLIPFFSSPSPEANLEFMALEISLFKLLILSWERTICMPSSTIPTLETEATPSIPSRSVSSSSFTKVETSAVSFPFMATAATVTGIMSIFIFITRGAAALSGRYPSI